MRRSDEPVTHGWTSGELAVVKDDPRYWSVAEAAYLLGPPQLTEAQVRHLVRMFSLTPIGKRANGPRRRYVRVYNALELIEAYERLTEVTEK